MVYGCFSCQRKLHSIYIILYTTREHEIFNRWLIQNYIFWNIYSNLINFVKMLFFLIFFLISKCRPNYVIYIWSKKICIYIYKNLPSAKNKKTQNMKLQSKPRTLTNFIRHFMTRLMNIRMWHKITIYCLLF